MKNKLLTVLLSLLVLISLANAQYYESIEVQQGNNKDIDDSGYFVDNIYYNITLEKNNGELTLKSINATIYNQEVESSGEYSIEFFENSTSFYKHFFEVPDILIFYNLDEETGEIYDKTVELDTVVFDLLVPYQGYADEIVIRKGSEKLLTINMAEESDAEKPKKNNLGLILLIILITLILIIILALIFLIARRFSKNKTKLVQPMQINKPKNIIKKQKY